MANICDSLKYFIAVYYNLSSHCFQNKFGSFSIPRYVRCDEMAAKAVKAVKTKELKIIPEQFEKTW
jgi:hypothetical protein